LPRPQSWPIAWATNRLSATSRRSTSADHTRPLFVRGGLAARSRRHACRDVDAPPPRWRYGPWRIASAC
jgi:hypothetical protein